MPSQTASLIPSVLDIYPRLRHRARRAAAEIRRLVDGLVVAFPDAALLARDPSMANRIDTTRYDHAAADFISAARAVTEAISALDEPP